MQFALLSTLFLATATASAQVVRDYYLLFSWIYGVKLPYFFKKDCTSRCWSDFPRRSFPVQPFQLYRFERYGCYLQILWKVGLASQKLFFFSLSWCSSCTLSVPETTLWPSQPLLTLVSLKLAVLTLVGSLSLPARKLSPNGTLQSLMIPNVCRFPNYQYIKYSDVYLSIYIAIWFFCKQLLPSPHCVAGKFID